MDFRFLFRMIRQSPDQDPTSSTLGMTTSLGQEPLGLAIGRDHRVLVGELDGPLPLVRGFG